MCRFLRMETSFYFARLIFKSEKCKVTKSFLGHKLCKTVRDYLGLNNVYMYYHYVIVAATLIKFSGNY